MIHIEKFLQIGALNPKKYFVVHIEGGISMKYRHNAKREGFTLVELLIVIVVIGVLSTMMMLSSTEAVTSAKASNVVSNLRNLKTAALALICRQPRYME